LKKAVFNPRWYCDEEYFSLEDKNLFSEKWLFAGVSSWVKNHGDFFTLPLCGREIVVHNLSNVITGYLNICPHRGGPLVNGLFGNSMPVCKYHGWTFRDGNHLTGQSNVEWFSADGASESCDRKLNSVNIKVIGPLIFINQSSNPIKFEEQFNSELIELFSTMGGISDTGFLQFNSPMNWKLNIENVKDYLHPYYIHPESFAPFLEMQKSSPVKIEKSTKALETYKKDVRLSDLSFMKRSNFAVSQLWWRDFIVSTQPNSMYQNIYLFPSTNFFIVSGGYYCFQQYLPVDSKNFTYRLTIAIPEKKSKFDTTALINSLLKLERDVIKEDDAVLLKVQDNLRNVSDREFFTHGDYEEDIMNQMLYLNDEIYK
jgi:phenylpropionate dioxygenase-like ring-hydroxylating dioxygenase large terminal subunit